MLGFRLGKSVPNSDSKGLAGESDVWKTAMNSAKLERLLGGVAISNLSRDANAGLNSLALRLVDRSDDDFLFETAMRQASDEDLRKLARLRLNAANSKHLD